MVLVCVCVVCNQPIFPQHPATMHGVLRYSLTDSGVTIRLLPKFFLILIILEHRSPGPLVQYLNSFEHPLIINGEDIENVKDLEGNEHFEKIGEVNQI